MFHILAFYSFVPQPFEHRKQRKNIIVLKQKNPECGLRDLLLEVIIPLYIQQEVLISTETVLYPVITVQLPKGVNMNLMLSQKNGIFYQHSCSF